MFTVGGVPCPVVDAQVHIWDASPHNQAGPDGEVYALDLLRRHRELASATVPPLPPVPPHEVERVSEAGLNRDVFGDRCVDRAALQPVVLGELFVLGLSPLEWHAEMAGVMLDRFVLCGELDPDGGQPGARGLIPRVRRFDLRGLTLCERGRPAAQMRLADPWLRHTLARCGAAGADIVHIGVGPSTRPAPWQREDEPQLGGPQPRPSRVRQVPRWAEPVRAGSAQPVRAGAPVRIAPPGFAAHQFRDLARALPDIHFVLGAGCLPTVALCRLAALPNVHVMLTEILPWTGSRDFAHAFGSLLAAFGHERLLFGSGYPMIRPGRLVHELATYRFPTELVHRYPRFNATAVRAVLGGNAARLYRIAQPVPQAAAGAAVAW